MYQRDAFTKYTWVTLLMDKEAKIAFNGFIGIVNESKHNPNKIWVDQEREFYNSLM